MRVLVVSIILALSLEPRGAQATESKAGLGETLQQVERTLQEPLGLRVKQCEFVSVSPQKGERVELQSQKLSRCLLSYTLANWFSERITGYVQVLTEYTDDQQLPRVAVFKIVWRPVILPEYKWWDFISFYGLVGKAARRGWTLMNHFADGIFVLESDRDLSIREVFHDKVVLPAAQGIWNDSEPRFRRLAIKSETFPGTKLKEKVIQVKVAVFSTREEMPPSRVLELKTRWTIGAPEAPFEVTVP